MSEAAQKKFQQLTRALARLIRAEADAALGVQKPKPKTKPKARTEKWTSAFIDARWFADAEGYTAKLRVVLPSGSLQSVRTSNDIDVLLDKLSRVRKEDTSAKWYGLKVTASFDGAVTTDLNTDPNCVVDPLWFRS
jgi:hypothetical protein